MSLLFTLRFRRHGFDEILRVFWVQKRHASRADELQLLIPHLLGFEIRAYVTHQQNSRLFVDGRHSLQHCSVIN